MICIRHNLQFIHGRQNVDEAAGCSVAGKDESKVIAAAFEISKRTGQRDGFAELSLPLGQRISRAGTIVPAPIDIITITSRNRKAKTA